MSFYNQGIPAQDLQDPTPVPSEFDTYAHIEGLVGEETRLREIAEQDRTQEHHERLRAISGELDRVWERLRERAERLRHSSKQETS
ncbi:MAG TPA: DUF2630 family protein [Solirubrobacteraceae bacterium]|nr:DUF2630 family protein [Solirubrobacteraceae bacterium]